MPSCRPRGRGSRRLRHQTVGFEDEGLDGAEERPGERRDNAGRFEVRTVAPTIVQERPFGEIVERPSLYQRKASPAERTVETDGPLCLRLLGRV